MKDIGRKTSSMAMVSKLGPMVLVTMVSMCKERSMEKANSLGPMVARIRGSSSRITYKEKESIIGPMVGSMMDSGSIIKWRATACSRGLMEDATKDPTLTTRRKGKVISIGPTAANTKVAGKMESSMALALTRLLAARRNKVNGPMASVFTGSRIHRDNSEPQPLV